MEFIFFLFRVIKFYWHHIYDNRMIWFLLLFHFWIFLLRKSFEWVDLDCITLDLIHCFVVWLRLYVYIMVQWFLWERNWYILHIIIFYISIFISPWMGFFYQNWLLVDMVDDLFRIVIECYNENDTFMRHVNKIIKYFQNLLDI